MTATVFGVVVDLLRLLSTALHSHTRLAAENLFLRKQLALYVERRTKPHRANNATRLALVILASFIEWRPVLTIVQPDTLLRWHPARLSAVVAVAVSPSWATEDSAGPAAADRPDGAGESHMGRRADCCRTVA